MKSNGKMKQTCRSCFLGLMLPMLLMLPAANSLAAQSHDVQRQVDENLGNINMMGLPRIIIPLPNNTELARFGFVFVMIHNVIPGYGGSARTEWRIPGLRTCVYLDGNGNLAWVRPAMQQLVFKKDDNYQQAVMGWSAIIGNNKQDVEFTNSAGQKWKYSGGFLKEISDKFTVVDFVTDQETILLATKRGFAGNGAVLMRAEYSEEGLLARLELGQSQPVIFRWSGTVAQTASLLDCPNAVEMKAGWQPALRGIEGLPAGEMTFDYDGMLLREWNSKGKRTNYTWDPRNDSVKSIGFGMAPVRLQSDSEFRYEYGNADGVDILRVFRHDGSFVSETKFGSRGIIQKLGDKTIRAIRRNDGTGSKLVIDSE